MPNSLAGINIMIFTFDGHKETFSAKKIILFFAEGFLLVFSSTLYIYIKIDDYKTFKHLQFTPRISLCSTPVDGDLTPLAEAPFVLGAATGQLSGALTYPLGSAPTFLQYKLAVGEGGKVTKTAPFCS